jgi:hypothetical protein
MCNETKGSVKAEIFSPTEKLSTAQEVFWTISYLQPIYFYQPYFYLVKYIRRYFFIYYVYLIPEEMLLIQTCLPNTIIAYKYWLAHMQIKTHPREAKG